MTPPILQIGATVYARGREGVLVGIGDFDEFGVSHDGQLPLLYKLKDLSGEAPNEEVARERTLDALTPDELALATRIYNILRPFLDGELRGRAALQELVAPYAGDRRLGLSPANAYRKVKAYRAYKHLSSLIPDRRPTDGDKRRIKDTAEERAMTSALDKYFLCRNPLKAWTIHTEKLPSLCRAYSCPVPSYDRLARRIRNLKKYEPERVLKAQKGAGAAKARNRQNRGSNPLSTGPLACVQADYWLVHAVMADSYFRESAGRPILCLATCTTTLMPWGYYLSFEPPSAAFIGVTMFVGFMPKDDLMKRLGVEFEWPVWGPIKMLHLDNAREFRGKLVDAVSSEYQFEKMNRPVKTPHFGGSIEARFKALAAKIEPLPGATGSNFQVKNGNPSKEAALTIDEFERYFLTLLKDHITQPNERLGGMSPLDKWKSYFFDPITKEPLRDLPLIPSDPVKLKLDLMPKFERLLGPKGIRLDHIDYDSHELVELRNSLPVGATIKVTIRRDPRDISVIFVFSQHHNRHIEVRWTYPTDKPRMNLWQQRAARRRLEELRRPIDQDSLMESHEERMAIVAGAGRSKAKARKEIEMAERGFLRAALDRPSVNPAAEELLPEAEAETPPATGRPRRLLKTRS